MVKKCVMCEDSAKYKIKDSSDYYCIDCAQDNFSDLSILIKVEEEAKRLQNFLDEKIDIVKLNDSAEIGEEKKEVKKLIKEGKEIIE